MTYCSLFSHKSRVEQPTTALRRYGQVQLITSKPTELALDWAIPSRLMVRELVPSVNGSVNGSSQSGGTVPLWGFFFVDHLLDQACFLLCVALLMVFVGFFLRRKKNWSVVTFLEKRPQEGFRKKEHIYMETPGWKLILSNRQMKIPHPYQLYMKTVRWF